jgi:hypothetical protein
MIVLFKVVLLVSMSTNTDLEWSVTNSSKIDTNFTTISYFVDKFNFRGLGVWYGTIGSESSASPVILWLTIR